MKSRSSRSHGSRVVVTLVLLAAILGAEAPASGSTKTLKRSVGNILQAPLDLVLSPTVALVSVVEGMREHDDPVPLRVAFFLPGVVWNTGVNLGASLIRLVTGGLELIPGVALLPFAADTDPLFSPVESAFALFETETSCCIDVKFGIDYTGNTKHTRHTNRIRHSTAAD